MRSNKGSQIGFLKDKSRLIVATSREKCAFYIIGNAKFLEERSPVLWKVYVLYVEYCYRHISLAMSACVYVCMYMCL